MEGNATITKSHVAHFVKFRPRQTGRQGVANREPNLAIADGLNSIVAFGMEYTQFRVFDWLKDDRWIVGNKDFPILETTNGRFAGVPYDLRQALGCDANGGNRYAKPGRCSDGLDVMQMAGWRAQERDQQRFRKIKVSR